MRAYAVNHLDLDPADIPVVEIHQMKTRRYGELIAEGTVPLRPGIAALIEAAARAGVRLAVATTTNLPNVDGLIRATLGVDAREVFQVVAAGDMVRAKKPAPDIYQLALDGLSLAAKDCLALEDSRNGLLSAEAAGIPCLVCPSWYTSGDDFSGAAAVIDSFEAAGQFAPLADLFAAVASAS